MPARHTHTIKWKCQNLMRNFPFAVCLVAESSISVLEMIRFISVATPVSGRGSGACDLFWMVCRLIDWRVSVSGHDRASQNEKMRNGNSIKCQTWAGGGWARVCVWTQKRKRAKKAFRVCHYLSGDFQNSENIKMNKSKFRTETMSFVAEPAPPNEIKMNECFCKRHFD